MKQIMMALGVIFITSCGSSEAQMFNLSEARHYVDAHPDKRFLTVAEVMALNSETIIWARTEFTMNGGSGWAGVNKYGQMNSVPGIEYPLAVYDKVSCGAQAVSSELPATFGSASTIEESVPKTIKEPVKIRIPTEGTVSPAVVVPGGTTISAD